MILAGEERSLSFDLVSLTPLMERSAGDPSVRIGVIDGPVDLNHPEFGGVIRAVKTAPVSSASHDDPACLHGTLVAGLLSARRESAAPGICPECTLLIRPVFAEADDAPARPPGAGAEELAASISDCINARVHVINLSVAIEGAGFNDHAGLRGALDLAARQGILIIAAAGNQHAVGSSTITRHPAVLPAVACDSAGRPLEHTNLGHSIGRNGLSAPGAAVTSLRAGGGYSTLSGTSAAAAIITGAAALLWSLVAGARPDALTRALLEGRRGRPRSIAPGLLDVWRSYQILTRSRTQ